MSTMLERLKDVLDSPEGQKIIDDYVLTLERNEKQFERNYERIVRIVNNIGLSNFIRKCYAWYDSDEYVKREYSLGYQPREPLYYLIHEYFRLNGVETDEGLNMFIDVNYKIDGWLVGMMHGQGSVVKIQKL